MAYGSQGNSVCTILWTVWYWRRYMRSKTHVSNRCAVLFKRGDQLGYFLHFSLQEIWSDPGFLPVCVLGFAGIHLRWSSFWSCLTVFIVAPENVWERWRRGGAARMRILVAHDSWREPRTRWVSWQDFHQEVPPMIEAMRDNRRGLQIRSSKMRCYKLSCEQNQ